MKYEEFTANVEKWQEEKGIYKHSTPLAQALKAVSEVGELADAVIKGDRDALKDSVGDVMVCLVGVAKMLDIDLEKPKTLDVKQKDEKRLAAIISYYVSDIALEISKYETDDGSLSLLIRIYISYAETYLNELCRLTDLDYLECCEAAWNEIKDRKGRMVEGGAFVKGCDV